MFPLVSTHSMLWLVALRKLAVDGLVVSPPISAIDLRPANCVGFRFMNSTAS